MENPYLDDFERLKKSGPNRLHYSMFVLRKSLYEKYSFAIPSTEAIQKIAEYSPLIEIGAGRGSEEPVRDTLLVRRARARCRSVAATVSAGEAAPASHGHPSPTGTVTRWRNAG